MAKLAIILHEGSAGSRELRLSRILDFFGVPWKAVSVSNLLETIAGSSEYVIFGSINAVAAALQRRGVALGTSWPAAVYVYAEEDRNLSLRALQSLLGKPNLSLENPPAGTASLSVSGELVGPMAGLKVSLQLPSEDAVLIGTPADGEPEIASIISSKDFRVFVRFQWKAIPVFFCTSPRLIDIDEVLDQGRYDVKPHFCSGVPLVMFIKFMFSDVAWRPQELGACLIIDDPLLKLKYGSCDFEKLRDLMRKHGFTTNIAFIPWNWRRTSRSGSEFFKNAREHFSVSIHGCDHTGDEFGTTSRDVLQRKAGLAQSRMQNHQARTGIQHDPVMVFPQGVFSSACPEVLSRSGFLAAVNTEVIPVDAQNVRTRISDVWDVAITAYGGFPIFTRRYPSHGLENFAFDLLLGKPCLIVVHHDSFNDGGAALVDLIQEIESFNCSLRWRSLGEVIRRACRWRPDGEGAKEVEMYGNELLVSNHSDRSMEVMIRKRAIQGGLAPEIFCDQKPVMWVNEAEHVVFQGSIASHSEKRFGVVYAGQAHTDKVRWSLHRELSVAVRRGLSEFRDNYLSRNEFLNAQAHRLKGALKRAI